MCAKEQARKTKRSRANARSYLKLASSEGSLVCCSLRCGDGSCVCIGAGPHGGHEVTLGELLHLRIRQADQGQIAQLHNKGKKKKQRKQATRENQS